MNRQFVPAPASAIFPAPGERPRILMVVIGFPDAAQPNRCIFNLRAAQRLRQVADVRVVQVRTWRPGRPSLIREDWDGVPLLRVRLPMAPRTPAWSLAVAQRSGWLVRPLREWLASCDVVHSVGVAEAGVLASAWARWAGVPHIVQVMNLTVPSSWLRDRIAGWDMHLHGVACNSEAARQAFTARFPAAPNTRVIYRGVDLDDFRVADNGAADDANAAGPQKDLSPVRYAFFGGFPAYSSKVRAHGSNTKGGDTLLAAWQAAEEELASLGASLLLAGPSSDNPRLQQWKAALRHPERVFFAGVLAPQLIAAHMRAADAVLIPSLEEGLPNVGMEAAACGRAVLASTVGGIPEIVEHGETGLLLPPGDAQAWANALVRQASRAAELRRMGERARQFMEARFDCRQYAPQMLALYQAALARFQQPAPSLNGRSSSQWNTDFHGNDTGGHGVL